MSRLNGLAGPPGAGVPVAPGVGAARAGLFDEQLKLAGLVAAQSAPKRDRPEAPRSGEARGGRPAAPSQTDARAPPPEPGAPRPADDQRSETATAGDPNRDDTGAVPNAATGESKSDGQEDRHSDDPNDAAPADAAASKPGPAGDVDSDNQPAPEESAEIALAEEALAAVPGAAQAVPQATPASETGLGARARNSGEAAPHEAAPQADETASGNGLAAQGDDGDATAKDKTGANEGAVPAADALRNSAAEAATIGPMSGTSRAQSAPQGRRKHDETLAGEKFARTADHPATKAPPQTATPGESRTLHQQTTAAAQDLRVETPPAASAVAVPGVELSPQLRPSDSASAVQADAATRAASRGAPRAGQTAQAANPGAEVDRVRFVQRVSRALQSLRDGGGSIRLRLSPPELGSLRVELTVRQGAMTARLEVENAAARNTLLDNLPALRERLAQQEIRLEKFDIDLAGDSSRGGLPQGPDDGSQPHGRPPERAFAAQGQRKAADSVTRPASPARAGDGSQLNVIV